MWMIEHVLAIHGVEASTPVVVYDDQSGGRAARAFWFLEILRPSVGADARRRIQRLEREGLAGHARGRRPRPSEWTGARNETQSRPGRELRTALGGRTVILDTRTDGEYAGTTVRAKRGGAVPGAVHSNGRATSRPVRRVQARRRAARMYADAGVTPDREVITSLPGWLPCRALVSRAPAARLSAGPDYVGSWKEWGDREELPIEVPKPN